MANVPGSGLDDLALACTNCFFPERTLARRDDGSIVCVKCGAVQPQVMETDTGEDLLRLVQQVTERKDTA